MLADLADMLAAIGNGSLEGEPIQLVDKALAIDPNHVKALALKGSYAMTQRDFRTALTAWNQALKVAQPDDPIAQFLRTQLDGMREMAAQALGGIGAGVRQPLTRHASCRRDGALGRRFSWPRRFRSPGNFVQNRTDAPNLRCVCTQLRPGPS